MLLEDKNPSSASMEEGECARPAEGAVGQEVDARA